MVREYMPIWMFANIAYMLFHALPLYIARHAMQFCLSDKAFIRNACGRLVFNFEGLYKKMETGFKTAITGTEYSNYQKVVQMKKHLFARRTVVLLKAGHCGVSFFCDIIILICNLYLKTPALYVFEI